jgi:hypothetical protein
MIDKLLVLAALAVCLLLARVARHWCLALWRRRFWTAQRVRDNLTLAYELGYLTLAYELGYLTAQQSADNQTASKDGAT